MKGIIGMLLIASTVLLWNCSTENKKVLVEKKKQDDTEIKPISSELPIDSVQLINENKPKIEPKKIKPPKKINRKEEKKITSAEQDIPVNEIKIPAAWEKTFSSDKKWMELYSLSKSSFIKGWENEFNAKPNTRVNEYELVFAYRRRMESAFNKTPEFIEFSVQRFSKDSDFLSFIKAFPLQVKPD